MSRARTVGHDRANRTKHNVSRFSDQLTMAAVQSWSARVYAGIRDSAYHRSKTVAPRGGGCCALKHQTMPPDGSGGDDDSVDDSRARDSFHRVSFIKRHEWNAGGTGGRGERK